MSHTQFMGEFKEQIDEHTDLENNHY